MQSLKGHLLIAAPQLSAPIFARSVILMLDHNDEGAIGVILNQPINTVVTDLSGKIFDDDFEWGKALHLGGPVPGSLTVLHTLEELGDQEIIPGVFATLDVESVHKVIHRRPEPSLVIANYSGWGPGQLEGEFQGDSWITLPATAEHVFWTGEKDLWKVTTGAVNSRKLFEFLRLKTLPEDPSLN
jgi:putative transcriptional regulator